MLNFHNVYDFFVFLRKVYKKGEKVRNSSATPSLRTFMDGQVIPLPFHGFRKCHSGITHF